MQIKEITLKLGWLRQYVSIICMIDMCERVLGDCFELCASGVVSKIEKLV